MDVILDRKRFRKYWNDRLPGLGDSDSVLWAYPGSKKCRWFVKVPKISINPVDFHLWCLRNCKGSIVCFSSADDEEWYGFTHKADIVYWILKWG